LVHESWPPSRTILMSDEVKYRPQLRVGLINEIVSEVIFIRMDQSLCEFFRRTTILFLCRDATLQWDTLYMDQTGVRSKTLTSCSVICHKQDQFLAIQDILTCLFG
jgi:hypothetical protein